MDAVQLGQKDDALLFVGVGAGDDSDDGFSGAGVVGKMRDVGGDVEEVAGADDGVMLKALAVSDTGFTGEGVDRGLMRGMFVGPGTAAGGNGD